VEEDLMEAKKIASRLGAASGLNLSRQSAGGPSSTSTHEGASIVLPPNLADIRSCICAKGERVTDAQRALLRELEFVGRFVGETDPNLFDDKNFILETPKKKCRCCGEERKQKDNS
jgi:hypothetical protein